MIAAVKVHLPDTDLALVDFVKTLVPADIDPEKALAVVEMLTPYKGATVEETTVKDAIAKTLGTPMSSIVWPRTWRRAD
jgi:hypothetical protein